MDWLKLFIFQEDVSQFVGQKASVIGFVCFDEALESDRFYASRFVVSCRAADGFAIAIPVRWSDAQSLEQDGWVVVKGNIESFTLDGTRLPLINAVSVEPIDAPNQPYLFT